MQQFFGVQNFRTMVPHYKVGVIKGDGIASRVAKFTRIYGNVSCCCHTRLTKNFLNMEFTFKYGI